MNNIQSQKYGYPPEAIEENAVRSEKFRNVYDFYRLLKVQKHAKRYARADAKKGKSLRRRLREKGARPGGTFEKERCTKTFI